MGFGLLFLGYLTVYILGMNSYGAFVLLLGYGLLYAGLSELQRYCHRFRWAKYCAALMGGLAVYRTCDGIGKIFAFSFPFVTNEITLAVGWADFCLTLVFHLLLVLAIRELADRVSLPKIASGAVFNLILCVLYYLLFAVYHAAGETGALWGLSMLMKLLWLIDGCVVVFSCYRYICPAEDPGKVRKPSRFAFVNRMRDAFEKKENEAIEADRAYHTENARRRKEKYVRNMSEKARKQGKRK